MSIENYKFGFYILFHYLFIVYTCSYVGTKILACGLSKPLGVVAMRHKKLIRLPAVLSLETVYNHPPQFKSITLQRLMYLLLLSQQPIYQSIVAELDE